MNDTFNDPSERLRRASANTGSAPELAPELVTEASTRRAPRLANHGRTVRGAGIGLATLAAISAGALVVASPFGARDPLFLAAPGTGGAESAALSSDSRIAWWVNYEYLAGEGLSDASGNGKVYELRRTGTPEAALQAAARALGLSGEPGEASYSTPEYPSYLIGPEDGSTASITLSWSGTGSWWYNDPSAYPEPICETVTSTNEDGTDGSYQDCTQPEIPASESLAPSADEARTLAAELFSATGFPVEPSSIRVTADSWQTVATASLVVDGIATAVEASVAWSPLGTISWASGHSVSVVERGSYDTVSAVSAVDRLTDGRWFGAAGPDYSGGAFLYAAEAGVARDGLSIADGSGENPDSPVSSSPAEPGTGEGSKPGAEPAEPTPGEEPTVEPAPVEEPSTEPLPEPETVTVTLEKAEATLLLLWDAEGNAWLVPGYAFENPEQGFWTAIVSLVEGVIALPELVEVEPQPAILD